MYGLGHAETILGQALKGRRHEVIIASKCGLPWDDNKNVRLDLSLLFFSLDSQMLKPTFSDSLESKRLHDALQPPLAFNQPPPGHGCEIST